MPTKRSPITAVDLVRAGLFDSLNAAVKFLDEPEYLRDERDSLRRAYAACEEMLRQRTEQLNQADAENERLRAELREQIAEERAEIQRLRDELRTTQEVLTACLESPR